MKIASEIIYNVFFFFLRITPIYTLAGSLNFRAADSDESLLVLFVYYILYRARVLYTQYFSVKRISFRTSNLFGKLFARGTLAAAAVPFKIDPLFLICCRKETAIFFLLYITRARSRGPYITAVTEIFAKVSIRRGEIFFQENF